MSTNQDCIYRFASAAFAFGRHLAACGLAPRAGENLRHRPAFNRAAGGERWACGMAAATPGAFALGERMREQNGGNRRSSENAGG